MIRDPSDGSVKEARRPMVSGMREPDQAAADELERLNKSREWLRNYQAAKQPLSQNPASNDEAKRDMPTSEAAE